MKTEVTLMVIGLIIAVIIGLAAWAKNDADNRENGYDEWDDWYGGSL